MRPAIEAGAARQPCGPGATSPDFETRSRAQLLAKGSATSRRSATRLDGSSERWTSLGGVRVVRLLEELKEEPGVAAADPQWKQDYTQVRPHSALGYRTPEEFAKMRRPGAVEKKAAGSCGKHFALPTFPQSRRLLSSTWKCYPRNPKPLRKSHYPCYP